MKCDNGICSFHDETMTDNCSKGEPPDVENCIILNFRKNRQTSEAVVGLNNLLSAAKVKKEETPSGWKQPYVSLRMLNFGFKRIYHTEDGATRCAEKINKLLASGT